MLHLLHFYVMAGWGGKGENEKGGGIIGKRTI